MIAPAATRSVRRAILAATVLLSLIAGPLASHGAGAQQGAEPAAVSPVVVELFTSQGLQLLPAGR